MNFLKKLPSLVGLSTLGYYSFEQGKRVYYQYLNSNEIDFQMRYGKCHGIVTGGSYGLGKEYAHELARRGINVVLIARGAEALQTTKKEILSKYPTVEVKTVQFDFSTTNPADYDQLASSLSDLDIGILINNVGTYLHGNVFDNNPEDIKRLLVTNTFPQTFLTNAFLKKLIERPERSLIVTVSSESGDFIHHEHPFYGASKSYNSMLSRSLKDFASDSKLDVSLFLPGPTKTPLLEKISTTFADTPYGKAYCAEASNSAKNSFRKITFEDEICGDPKHNYYHFMHRFFRPISDIIYSSN